MSERLEKEIEQYTKESLAIKFPVLDRELITSDIRHTAQYFYNLALEDMKKEVLKLNKINKQIAEEKGECSKWQEGVSAGYAEVLSTIDQLSK